ncbi:MAG: glycoside hydrolase [Anaerosolibacter sp.]|jgi:spore germination protein YaaH|uniref:glycosyl hydrolase family 18 protein n=1 Tax=Anaerosolibacter sp. TaxID=1872527 RepID=UPI0026295E29|nr:glycosyl hydrolase family 18 protein [Anaerosolibacter sp.]MDF2545302.1 glycoside hydrolase [Anaerosolibacter sp.]
MKRIYWFIGLSLILGVAAGFIFMVFQSQEVSPVSYEGRAKIVIGARLVEEEPLILYNDDILYMPYEVIKNYINQDIILSEDQKRVYMPLQDTTMELENKELTEYVKNAGVQVNIPTRIEEGTIFIPVTLLKEILGIKIDYIEDGATVIIDAAATEISQGEIVGNKVGMKEKASRLEFSKAELKLGDRIVVFEEVGDWYHIRSNTGELGYVEKKHVQILNPVESPSMQINEKRAQEDLGDKKINIAWEYVHDKSPNIGAESRIQSLDVVVPTWFSIADESGIVMNKGNRHYVNEAHKKGYKVWGLVDNGFDPALTSQILQDPQKRKQVIGQLLMYASIYNLDGINVDFENIYYKDKDVLTAFVRELSYYTNKQNISLSMDVTVPSSSEQWSKVYDRKELAKHVDYMAVMTYDEHWATSPVSGSVASMPWVERGIIRSMENIPPEKLLLGLPFYTRVWKEYRDETGKIKVESKAVSMVRAKEIIEEKDAAVLWNEDLGQYYAQYEEDGATFKIWLEDARSIALKTTLVEKYDLAGTASWRRGFEDQDVWMVLDEIIKRGREYHELSFENN